MVMQGSSVNVLDGGGFELPLTIRFDDMSWE
jgi:hypothetical protein